MNRTQRIHLDEDMLYYFFKLHVPEEHLRLWGGDSVFKFLCCHVRWSWPQCRLLRREMAKAEQLRTLPRNWQVPFKSSGGHPSVWIARFGCLLIASTREPKTAHCHWLMKYGLDMFQAFRASWKHMVVFWCAQASYSFSSVPQTLFILNVCLWWT